ncbi:MAG: dockerin type I domain-containing protein, partial [Verrucomicrobiota bacterium]|nr:dockerin type I domain-containing protein [Verrucomicrobiota bacterium]
VFADLIGRGVLAPGASPGTLTVNGNMTLVSPAELQIELGGTTAGTQYDQVVQHSTGTGGVTLGGDLTLAFVNGFESTVRNSDSFTILTSDLALAGAFANVANGARLHVSNGSGSFLVNYSGNNVVLSAFLPTPLSLTSAVSRKVHGGTEAFDVPLPLSGPAGVEPRRGPVAGAHTIVCTFSNALVSGNASVTAGTASIDGAPQISGNTMTLQLADVSDVQTITVTLSNVTDTLGQSLPSGSVSMSLLLGDANNDRSVNAADATVVRNRSGQAVDTTNFRADVNADGAFNSADSVIVRNRSGSSLPPAAPVAPATERKTIY